MPTLSRHQTKHVTHSSFKSCSNLPYTLFIIFLLMKRQAESWDLPVSHSQ